MLSVNNCVLVFQKQLNNLNKVTSNLLDIINSTREEWDNESSNNLFYIK